MRSSTIRATVAVALLVTAACIDDPAALSDDPLPLSAAEAEILGVTVWRDIMLKQQEALANARNVQGLIDFVTQADDGRVDVELVLIEECELGGDREVDGTVVGEADPAGNGFVEVEIVQRWDGCALIQGDQRLRLTGDPNVDARIRYDFTADGQFDVEGRMEGNVISQFPDGRSGSCVYSATFSGAESLTTGRFVFRTKGLVCGEAVNLREEL